MYSISNFNFPKLDLTFLVLCSQSLFRFTQIFPIQFAHDFFFFFHFESSFSSYSPLAWNTSSGIAFTGSVFVASIYIFHLSKNKLINFFFRGLHFLCEDSPAPRLWKCYSTRFSEIFIDLLLTLNSKSMWSCFLCEVWGRGLRQPLVFCSLAFVAVAQSLKSCLTLFDPMNCRRPGFTISRSLLKLMSIESVMPSNHLIFCCPLLLLPSVFPSMSLFQ